MSLASCHHGTLCLSTMSLASMHCMPFVCASCHPNSSLTLLCLHWYMLAWFCMFGIFLPSFVCLVPFCIVLCVFCTFSHSIVCLTQFCIVLCAFVLCCIVLCALHNFTSFYVLVHFVASFCSHFALCHVHSYISCFRGPKSLGIFLLLTCSKWHLREHGLLHGLPMSRS